MHSNPCSHTIFSGTSYIHRHSSDISFSAFHKSHFYYQCGVLFLNKKKKKKDESLLNRTPRKSKIWRKKQSSLSFFCLQYLRVDWLSFRNQWMWSRVSQKLSFISLLVKKRTERTTFIHNWNGCNDKGSARAMII